MASFCCDKVEIVFSLFAPLYAIDKLLSVLNYDTDLCASFINTCELIYDCAPSDAKVCPSVKRELPKTLEDCESSWGCGDLFFLTTSSLLSSEKTACTFDMDGILVGSEADFEF